jgi:hypothetical protein
MRRWPSIRSERARWTRVASCSAGVGPSGAYFTSLADPVRAALLGEWRRLLGSPAGAFRLTAHAWYAVGRA